MSPAVVFRGARNRTVLSRIDPGKLAASVQGEQMDPARKIWSAPTCNQLKSAK